jgi:branched-subunit amino acid transport protein
MSDAAVWMVILGLGAATYAIRFSFLAMSARSTPSPVVERLLRYVPTAVIPALVTPMVVWDRASGTLAAPSVWLAAIAAVAVGWRSGRLVLSLCAGLATLHLARAAGL